MKLKTVVRKGCSTQFRDAIEGMRDEVVQKVIGPCLKRPGFGPAEFYIQECDVAVSRQDFCEVRLSGVSLARDRSEKDFDDARDTLQLLYVAKIEGYLPRGEKMQLMVSIMLDGPRGDGSSLVEGEPMWVEGKCENAIGPDPRD